jgi:TPR repeat protein
MSAQNTLGGWYKNGIEAPRDLAEGFKWLRMSAINGDVCGQYNLGVCYEKGEGVEQNLEEAIVWYSEAAKQGDETAKRRLQLIHVEQ